MGRIVRVLLLFTATGSLVSAEPGSVDFDREIRPILSSHCYQCHGPDSQTREAGLRLDTRAGLFGTSKDDRTVISPGEPEKSELVRRIGSNDQDRMPPMEGGKPLSAEQITLLRTWIQQGAVWRRGWSYEPVQRPPVPVEVSGLAENPIDAFLSARWNMANVKAAPEADQATLARRLNFDLTGLPPSDPNAAAAIGLLNRDVYVRHVDRLLASPQFGERMAVYWLDLVRYADSCGYHSDVDQPVSPYRDYVIGAFNRNISFDQFTREQLAGDLLVEPTLEQQIATGFNRLSKSTEEGGAQEGEYLAKAFADRVRTVSGTWLALTLGCAECHDHKFDPVTTRDFYSLGAFFADVKERGVYSGGAHDPELSLPTQDEMARLQSIAAEIARMKELRPAADGSPSDQVDQAEKEIKKLEQQRKEIEKQISRTLVTVSVPPRPIRILPRGDWLNQSGEIVEPAFPTAFPQTGAEGRRKSRLDLADWLVQRENPLTTRVFVNRLWKLFFGTGLARTLDDFGAQGEPPSHPELLDWLAVEFVESGWDIKHMIRLMVTSRAYRLSSVPTNELLERDPQNRLFARQSRWRLEAEFLRDNALMVSGLLVDRIGGPSVKPYQPEGYWEFLNFPKRTWTNSTGPDQYRRGLYTHWQRTFLHPSLLAFDAPSREECTASRMTSNTPKSALALLNDSGFVEMARVFAERIQREGGDSDLDRLNWAWTIAMTRSPDDQERSSLLQLLASSRTHFGNDPAAARELQTVGQAPAVSASNSVESAAWIAVARAIFNLHEFTVRN